MRYTLALIVCLSLGCGAPTGPESSEGTADASTIGPNGTPCPAGWRVCPMSQRGTACVAPWDFLNCGTCNNNCIARGFDSCTERPPYVCQH